MNTTQSKPTGLAIILILVQLADIAIHVAINDVEPIRVLSNLIIIGWTASLLASLNGVWERVSSVSLTAVTLYLLLNLIFLAQNGLTNPHQGDTPRTALFVLLFLTCTLSYGIWAKIRHTTS